MRLDARLHYLFTETILRELPNYFRFGPSVHSISFANDESKTRESHAPR